MTRRTVFVVLLAGTVAVVAALSTRIERSKPPQEPDAAGTTDAPVWADQREPVGWVFGRMIGVRPEPLFGPVPTSAMSPPAHRLPTSP